jgi:hypothetical protein
VRFAALVVSVCLLAFGTANAQTVESQAVEESAIVTSDSHVATVTYKAGTSRIEVAAGRDVNVQDLMTSAKIRPNDDPQTIVDKVDAVRKRYYPEAEISLIASVPRSPGTATSAVRLYKYYVLWNRRGSFYAYWNVMGAAVTFLGRVSGAWNYYECIGCSTWRFYTTVRSGGSLTRANYGAYTRRGFNYVPAAGSKADIIMYFFD